VIELAEDIGDGDEQEELIRVHHGDEDGEQKDNWRPKQHD
jgi:hypothetical protein